MKYWTNLLLLTSILLTFIWASSQTATFQPVQADSQTDSPTTTAYMPLIQRSSPYPTQAITINYGVNFMSSAEDPADEQQYQNALATQATWNRWPLYWPLIEPLPDQFDWSAQDSTALADIEHGLQINAILLGTPSYYTTHLITDHMAQTRPVTMRGFTMQAIQAAAPLGLYEPIFIDGTDEPGPEKQINEANVWARFVWTAVNRYKPDGLLAKQNGWPAGIGITHWEMWNEPDLTFFWDSSLEDYARLLKVGYLATKQADPNAQVLSGAMAYFALPNYYHDILAIYAADPLAATYNSYHDIFAIHSYLQSGQSGYYVVQAADTMTAYGLSRKPIWLNESGVPAWDDYPGPTWEPTAPLRATMAEQANYTIQSAFHAAYARADAIFHFQLYDSCGNQPYGTDFPPHNGELCDSKGWLIGQPGVPCAGDANGLYSNPTDAACFTQHPQPESPRPNLAAFQLVTQQLNGVAPYWRLRPGGTTPDNGRQEWIAFYRPSTQERIVGMWARFGTDETAVIAATSPTQTAQLIYPDGTTETITAVNNHYTIPLPAATNQNAPWDSTLYPIGGRPVILIEKMP